MNAIYQRYLSDDDFRAAILAAARRERGEAMGRFLARSVRFLLGKEKKPQAPRAHLARQG